MKTAYLAFFPLLLVLTTGCKKTPEDICKKMDALEAKSDKKDKDSKKKDDPAACARELTKLQTDSPEAYACVAKCSESSVFDQASACAFACAVSDPKLKAKSEEKKKAEAAAKEQKVAGWADLPLAEVKGTLSAPYGKKTPVGFTIQLAKGFAEASTGSSDAYRSYELKEPGEYFGPTVSVSKGYSVDLDSAIKSSEITKDTVVKKEKTANGYILNTESEHGMSTEVAVKIGDLTLQCRGHLSGDEAKKQKAKLVPWMEKMCTSMKGDGVEPAKAAPVARKTK